jgi:hypothetical protein
VAADGERQVFGVHPPAVVDDPDQGLSAGRRRNLDPARAGVDRILDQFLHNARWPLDDFTGGDLVDQGLWQLVDAHGAMFRDSVLSAMFGSRFKQENVSRPLVCRLPSLSGLAETAGHPASRG